MKVLKKVSITNLERLVTDKNVQSVLGIEINDNGIVEASLLREEVKKGLLKIINDLSSGTIKVKDIYTKDNRKDYIESFNPSKDLPDDKKKADSVWDLTDSEPKDDSSQKRPPKKTPLSTDRDSLIPNNCILQIKEQKINKIYKELKSIGVDNFTNASAVLFRVFLELSIDAFNEKYVLPKRLANGKQIILRERIKAVAKYMEDKGMATKNELKGVRVIASNTDGLYSVDTFNDFVHNRHFSPISKDIKTGWDNIQIFFEKLWSNV